MGVKTIPKHELEVDWLKSSYKPDVGEIVVYDIEVDENGQVLTIEEDGLLVARLPHGRNYAYTIERQKIGDGIHNVNELEFCAVTKDDVTTEIELFYQDLLKLQKTIPLYNKKLQINKEISGEDTNTSLGIYDTEWKDGYEVMRFEAALKYDFFKETSEEEKQRGAFQLSFYTKYGVLFSLALSKTKTSFAGIEISSEHRPKRGAQFYVVFEYNLKSKYAKVWINNSLAMSRYITKTINMTDPSIVVEATNDCRGVIDVFCASITTFTENQKNMTKFIDFDSLEIGNITTNSGGPLKKIYVGRSPCEVVESYQDDLQVTNIAYVDSRVAGLLEKLKKIIEENAGNIGLSNYYNKSEVNSLIANYDESEQVDAALASAKRYTDKVASEANQSLFEIFGGKGSSTPTPGLKYKLSDDGTYYILMGRGTATDLEIVIASEIDGIPVTEIASEAFADYSNSDKITSVNIPNTITTIGSGAFSHTYDLASLYIPKSVISISGPLRYMGGGWENFTIYCEASEKPEGWAENWNVLDDESWESHIYIIHADVEWGVPNPNTATTEDIKEAFDARVGNSGIYVGSGDMPDNCNVQIDPDGDVIEVLSADEVRNIVTEEVANAEGTIIVQAPTFVDSVEEMTDTSKVYILTSTGTIWAYKSGGTTIQTITEKIVGTTDNPWGAGRLSGGNLNDTAGYVTTPYIDLQKYSVPFELHLEGIPFVYNNDGNRRYSQYKTDKTHIDTQMNQATAYQTYWKNAVFTDNGDETCVISFTPPVTNKSDVAVGYARFSGKGTEADANVYITYQGEVSGGSAWVDTGVIYGSGEKLPTMINFSLANKSVKEFMDSADYDSNNYDYTQITNYIGNEYYRKDVSFPVILAWDSDENAVQYAVSVDGYIYHTSENRLSVWNLIPNTTYSYKVTALCADGMHTLVKSGSFDTKNEPTRMLYIEGIQNARDIGGYTVVSGSKVKYGLVYRGSAMDEIDYKQCLISGDGKHELISKVGVKTDLDLRGLNNVNEGALGKVIDFYAPQFSYGSYTNAITDATQKGYFKDMLEYIVTQLTANKPVYIHCSGGCDRTGTLVFLLLGLLGVSESDLAKEYELSSFSAIGAGRRRDSTSYDYKGMVTAIKAFSGTTITDKFEAFATACGVSTDTISQFRALMLA